MAPQFAYWITQGEELRFSLGQNSSEVVVDGFRYLLWWGCGAAVGICQGRGRLGLSWFEIPSSARTVLQKGMATHSSILAWRIPWTEEPGRQQSMGSQRVGHDWSNLKHMHTRTEHQTCSDTRPKRKNDEWKLSEVKSHGTSLLIQRRRLCTPNAGGLGSIPGWGTRPHMLQTRVHRLQVKECHRPQLRTTETN